MSDTARRFYQRYALLTSILPSVLSALICFGLRYVSSLYPISESRPIYFTLGGLVLLACAGSMPLLAAAGFSLSGLPRLSRSPSRDEMDQLQQALAPVEDSGREVQVKLLALPGVPFLAISAGKPDLLWMSDLVLQTTPPEDLRCLVLHERAHLAARGWFDDLFANWAFFTIASSVAALHFVPWSFRLALLAVTPLTLLRLRAVWSASREREADRIAALQAGLERYSMALARHLKQLEQPNGSTRLRRARLKGLGLDRARVEDLIAAVSELA